MDDKQIDESNPEGFSAETLEAMEDAVAGRTFGPFDTLEEMWAAIEADD